MSRKSRNRQKNLKQVNSLQDIKQLAITTAEPKVKNTLESVELSDIFNEIEISVTAEPQEIAPEVVVPEVVVPEFIDLRKTTNKTNTNLFSGLVVDIVRAEASNRISYAKIGSIIEDRPQICIAHHKELPEDTQINDIVEFSLHYTTNKNGDKTTKTASKIRKIKDGPNNFENMLNSFQKEGKIKSFSSQQLKTLIATYAPKAKTAEEAVKAIEEKYSAKFIGIVPAKIPMYAFKTLV